jgi:hypothetical protein
MTAMYKPSTMSKEERSKIYGQYVIARDAGDMDKAYAILGRIPLLPGLARVGKEALGIRYMQESGFNLADAVNEFGSKWLNEDE